MEPTFIGDQMKTVFDETQDLEFSTNTGIFMMFLKNIIIRNSKKIVKITGVNVANNDVIGGIVYKHYKAYSLSHGVIFCGKRSHEFKSR